jgi:hypothetical protein
VVAQSLIDGTGRFYGIVAVEIAGKVSSVVIGVLLLRTMFPLFGRAATHGVPHSGLLPVLGLLVASTFYGFKLVEPGVRDLAGIDRGVLLTSSWILFLPVLGFLDELHWMRGERRRTIEVSPERIEVYKQLEEVVRPSDRVFSFVSLVAILVAFVLGFLLESGQGRSGSTLLPKLLPIVALFLLAAWSLEVSARHNRLDERLADSSSIGTASDSAATM